MILALIAATQSRIAAFNSASEKKRRLRSFASTKRWTIWTATSTFALASVVDCRACRYDLPNSENSEDHTSLPSVLRSRDRADQPAPILGRGPAGLQESKRTALHDLDRVDRYRT